jgi:hypothetical protein
MKQKILFAIIMGCITTGLVSFIAIIINYGFAERFLSVWLKTWLISYLIVVPMILILAPKIQHLVNTRLAPMQKAY